MPTESVVIDSTDGVRLHVHVLGDAPAGAPMLLLCHATGFHGRVWDAVAAELPGYRCLAPDFRGFGDSSEQTSGELSWHGFADDLLATIDHFGLDDVRAIGHSKGAAAMLLAEQRRPGTFARMVGFEPIVFPPLPAERGAGAEKPPLAEGARRRRERFDSFEEAVERFAAKPPLGRLRRDVLESYVHHGFQPDGDGIVLKARRDHEAQTYETGVGHGGFAHLGEVTCPVLVCASGDGGAPATIAPMIADALPDARLHRFPDLAHFGPLEDPVAFAAVARSFLDEG